MATRVFLLALAWLLAMPAAALNVQTLDLPDLGEAAEPSVSHDPHAGVFVLSWQRRLGDGCVALETATLDPDGQLGEIKPVASGCDWFVNWADFPSVTVADNGDWLSFYLQRTEGDYGYAIRLLRSRDQGSSWSAPFSPHPEGTTVQHGFVSMAPLLDERLLIAWLDGRSPPQANGVTTGQADHQHHQHARTPHAHGEAAMTLRSATISRDGRVEEQQIVDSRVCSCCNTALLRHNDSHWLAYRDRSPDEFRDIALARRQDAHWYDQGLVREDGWQISGCPVNGPAMAESGELALVAWPSMGDGEMAVRATVPGSEISPVLLASGHGVQGRVAAAGWQDGWLVSWLGPGEDGQTGLQLVHLDQSLQRQGQWTLADLTAARASGMPRMASDGRQVVMVWTEMANKDDGPIPVVAVRRLLP